MERFPIEPEELLPEEAQQVEVHYQDPLTFDPGEFEKKGKHKHGMQDGGGDARQSSLGSEAQGRVIGFSMHDGVIDETYVTPGGQVLERSYVNEDWAFRQRIAQAQLGGPGIHPISADAVHRFLRYRGVR